MNASIRWRIITLQSIMVVVLAAASGFAFFEGNFVTSMIRDQLVAQQIYFPTTAAFNADTRSSEYPAEFKNYVSTPAVQIDNGDKARVYANDYLGIHLKSVANGGTYATVSTQLQALNAQLAKTPKDDPGYAGLQSQINTLSGQRTTLLQGETLRSMLLNAYGWYTFGTYTLYAGIGLMVGALAVFGALVFELFIAGRKPEKVKIAQKIAA